MSGLTRCIILLRVNNVTPKMQVFRECGNEGTQKSSGTATLLFR